MKNPFNFLYYTGLTIFISLSLVIGLFAINLQNILKLIPNKKETATEIVPKTDSYVLENLQPVKPEIPKVIKQEIVKSKEQDVIKPAPLPIAPTNTNKDSNSTPIIKDSLSPPGGL